MNEATFLKSLSPAKKFIYENAEMLAEEFVLGDGSFLIEHGKYDPSYKDELINELISLSEVENAIESDNGITVYLY